MKESPTGIIRGLEDLFWWRVVLNLGLSCFSRNSWQPVAGLILLLFCFFDSDHIIVLK